MSKIPSRPNIEANDVHAEARKLLDSVYLEDIEALCTVLSALAESLDTAQSLPIPTCSACLLLGALDLDSYPDGSAFMADLAVLSNTATVIAQTLTSMELALKALTDASVHASSGGSTTFQ